MQRRVIVVSFGLLLGVLSNSCARNQVSRPVGPITIVFKHAKHPRYAFLTEVVRKFEAENPQIRIREEILPASTDEQHQFYVINLVAGANDFDVLDMDVIWVPEFARAGWLMELTSQVSAAELKPLNPAALRADWPGGKLFAVPWFVDAGGLH